MQANHFKKSLIELIRRASCELPKDIVRAIEEVQKNEKQDSPARFALDSIVKNIELAHADSQPLCQDTGSIHIYAALPHSINESTFRKEASAAVAEATKLGLLRENAVDPVSGDTFEHNIGPGSPAFHIKRHDGNTSDIRIVLKGGGCENVSVQYSLPNRELNAHRDLEGVRRCVLDSVLHAQGKGCAPGIAGVCIGGDRTTGYDFSKEQLLRKIDERNPDPKLAELEERIVRDANELGIGPMGFGGKSTLIGCLIGTLARVPASYFVSVTYMCWAFRRQGVRLNGHGEIVEWI